MQLSRAVNVKEEQAKNTYALIPDGTVATAIAVSEENKTSTAGVSRLVLKFEIVEGPYKKRNVWHDLHLNSSDKGKAMAMRQIAEMGAAVGVDMVTDTNQIMRKPMLITIIVEKGTGTFEDKNKIKKFAKAGPKAIEAPAAANRFANASPPYDIGEEHEKSNQEAEALGKALNEDFPF